jgi:UDP-2,3-diacylglucosamine hydrolase
MRKVLFISDLHLDPAAPAIARQFLRFLAEDARGAGALYILGDLFEVWLGDDDPAPEARAIVSALRELSTAGVPCYFMHGNRDFLVGERFATETGCRLLQDGSVVDVFGEHILLMHGDALCTDDRSYQRLRRIVRNPVTQWVFRRMSLEQRRGLADRLRAGSRTHVGETAPEIMDVNAGAVTEAFRRAKVTTLVHGHTHRPAIHRLDVDGTAARRIVLGDWHTQGSVLEWGPDGVELRALPR